MMGIVLGNQKVVLIRMNWGRSVWVRSLACDMCWPLFSYVLGKFWIWAAGVFTLGWCFIKGERDYRVCFSYLNALFETAL